MSNGALPRHPPVLAPCDAGAVGPDGREDRYRRHRAWLLKVAFSLTGVGAYAALIEPQWPQVTHREIYLTRLPAAWDGLRVAHLTDFHFGDLQPAAIIARGIDLAVAEAPDIALLTGDFVSRHCHLGTEALAALRRLTHLPLGAWGVLGNHDRSVGGDYVAAAVASAGVRVLRNEAHILERASSGSGLCLAGMDWPRFSLHHLSPSGWRRWEARLRASLHAALGCSGPETCCVLLAHAPDVFPLVVEAGVDLALAGHTHGGQICLPGIGPLRVPVRMGRRYVAGLFRMGATQMYVSRGIGVVGLPMRFLCRPEVAVLTLRRGG
ncbi:MAG: metallophosphoesterase [Armatimonadetes bacterium]|nr:metallophosphoesterase [Armatimonadota bacterium]